MYKCANLRWDSVIVVLYVLQPPANQLLPVSFIRLPAEAILNAGLPLLHLVSGPAASAALRKYRAPATRTDELVPSKQNTQASTGYPRGRFEVGIKKFTPVGFFFGQIPINPVTQHVGTIHRYWGNSRRQKVRRNEAWNRKHKRMHIYIVKFTIYLWPY